MPAGLSQNSDARVVSRRRLVLSLAGSFGLGVAATAAGLRIWDSFESPFQPYWKVVDQAVPAADVKTSVSFVDAIERLISSGVVDPEKLGSYYRTTIGLPDWMQQLFSAPSTEPIHLSFKTAPYLLNLLWPLGLSNKAAFNANSPISGPDLASLASTSGWLFGKQESGAVYFNAAEAVRLTEAQERQVLDVATNVYRPCCDNSTFYQDCNHGSALLGLIELAASQGAPTEEIYRIALAANSYWFPDQYAKTALYLALSEGRSWMDVPPDLVLGPRFSSLSGWQSNINQRLRLASFMSRIGQMRPGACTL
jgi:hypothetical protein